MNESNQCEERRLPEPDRGCIAVAPPQQSPQKYEVNIVQAENGFIIRIGCKVFVFAEWVLASEALALWFKNPEEAQKKYCRN